MNEQIETLGQAIAAAALAHAGQVDKAGQPYILHPLRVMLAMPNDPVLQMAAVLHDVLEDCPSFDKWRLPERVRFLVEDLTRNKGRHYAPYITRLGLIPNARIVKLADLADNLDRSRIADPTERDLARWAKYERAAEWLKGPRTHEFGG